MTWVKLCGMTRREDVETAARVGADAVGFVLYEESPRRVSVETVAALVEGVSVESFLVTVDADPEWLVEAAQTCGVTGVQPHGAGSGEAVEAGLGAGLSVLLPIPVGSVPPRVPVIPDGARPLFDTASSHHGGTGKPFDWSLLSSVQGNFVLAGGLRPENAAAAVEATGAWGVDVSSGVESAPGLKEEELMRRLVEAVR